MMTQVLMINVKLVINKLGIMIALRPQKLVPKIRPSQPQHRDETRPPSSLLSQYITDSHRVRKCLVQSYVGWSAALKVINKQRCKTLDFLFKSLIFVASSAIRRASIASKTSCATRRASWVSVRSTLTYPLGKGLKRRFFTCWKVSL